MTLYAITDKITGTLLADSIFGTMGFYKEEGRAQSVLHSYTEEYQKFYEVTPFNVTAQ